MRQFLFSAKWIALITILIFQGCITSKNAIQFDKIIYHSTTCYGGCPAYHLLLNNNKSIWLDAEYVYKDKYGDVASDLDSTKMGFL
jgi:hypothetical protein